MDKNIKKRVVCVGDGIGLHNPDSVEFNNWLLSLPNRKVPKVLYVPTASGDSEGNILELKQNLADYQCDISVLSLFNRKYNDEDLREFILSHDIIYVDGGNTANMLAIWDAHGLRPIFKEAYESGIVLSGKSAGAMCWFEGGLTDSYGPELKPITNTLGLISGSYIPHFEPEDKYRRSVLRQSIKEGSLPDGMATERGVSLSYENGELTDIIAENPELRAEQVRNGNPKEIFKDLKPTKIMRNEIRDYEDIVYETEFKDGMK